MPGPPCAITVLSASIWHYWASRKYDMSATRRQTEGNFQQKIPPKLRYALVQCDWPDSQVFSFCCTFKPNTFYKLPPSLLLLIGHITSQPCLAACLSGQYHWPINLGLPTWASLIGVVRQLRLSMQRTVFAKDDG